MKKKLLFSVLALLLVCITVLPSAAATTPLAYNLSAYGQQTIVVGKATTTPPTVDGTVSENEYTKKVRITYESDGMYFEGTAVDDKTQVAQYIDLYFSYDDEKIYMAAVVQEDAYTHKDDSGSYSTLTLNFGFHTDGSPITAMDRMECTLNIQDKAATKFFAGNGYYEYDGTGAYYPNAEHASADKNTKNWGYMSAVMPDKFFARDTDDNNKNITVYEFSLSKTVLAQAFGLTELGNTCYFYFNDFATNNDAGRRTGLQAYRQVLGDEAYLALVNEYGWAASFVGHLLVLGEETDLVIPADTEDNVTDEVTGAPTGEATPTPTVEPGTSAQTKPATTATGTTATPGTSANSGSSDGGCQSAMGLSVIALLTTVSCGAAAICKKKKK